MYRTTGYAGIDGHEYPYDSYSEDYSDDDSDPVLDALALGLAGPRQRVSDLQWAGQLRRFGRAAVWCLPAAVAALAVTSWWGWPAPGAEPHGASPGTWLLVTVLGLTLWAVGLVAVTALAVSTPGRPWAVASLLLGLSGALALAPMLGVLGARPAGGEPEPRIPSAPSTPSSSKARSAAGSTVGGLLLLALSAVALAMTILASEVLNRFDGWLVLGGGRGGRDRRLPVVGVHADAGVHGPAGGRARSGLDRLPPHPRRASAGRLAESGPRPAGRGARRQNCRVEVVTDAHDERLADYRALTDVELRTRFEPPHGLFIAEGELVLRRALAGGYRARSILVDAKRLDQVADLRR